MKFVDLIKNSVISEFTGSVSMTDILISLGVAFLIGIFIIVIYKKTFTGVIYSKSFCLCVIMLAMVTSLIIRTINSNLALSLGMVGALSIVRFRTAVKEPVDTAFMFWAITAGIMTGAGLYLVAAIATIGLGVLFFVSYAFVFKGNVKYLLVIKYDSEMDDKIMKALEKISKYKIKSKTLMGDDIELSFEVSIKNNETNILDSFKNKEGIKSASLISYQNDFGA